MKTSTARAYANIALCKYWGKRDTILQLPTKSSISVGVSALFSETTVQRHADNHDRILFNGSLALESDAAPIYAFLIIFRNEFGIHDPLFISTRNSFCHAAGLASSASGFAALALALNSFFGLNLLPQQIAQLARRGSGSACRSIKGGFMYWEKGIRADGTDSVVHQIASSYHWPELCILTVLVDSHKKSVSSRSGMQLSMNTSPHYNSWVNKSEMTIPLFIEAIQKKDFKSLAQLTNDEWTSWQQVLATTRPPLHYSQPSTYKIITCIDELQSSGIDCFYTTDAGANVHIFSLKEHAQTIVATLEKLETIQSLIVSTIASDAYLVE